METATVAAASAPTYFDHPVLLALVLLASMVTWAGIFRWNLWLLIAPSVVLSVVLMVSWPVQWLYQLIAGHEPAGWHVDACVAVSFALVVCGSVSLLALLKDHPTVEETGSVGPSRELR